MTVFFNESALVNKERSVQADEFGDFDDDGDDNDHGDNEDDRDEDDSDEDDSDVRDVRRYFDTLESPVESVESGLKTLLVRKSYIDLFETILKYHHILVTGNPGIGKSMFMVYVIFRLRKIDKKEKIFIVGVSKTSSYFFIKDDVVHYCEESEALKEFIKLSKDKEGKDIYYLFDCGTNGTLRPLPAIALGSKKSIVFSSPDMKNYRDYQKDCISHVRQKGVVLYMPTWSLLEINDFLSIGEALVDRKTVMERFTLFGGIPRNIFSCGDNQRNLDDLNAAILFGRTAEMLTVVRQYETANKHSHKVIQIVPKKYSFYTKFFIDFTSRHVELEVVRYSMENDQDNFLKMLLGSANSPDLAVIRGRYFESFAHYIITKGGDFNIRCLEDNTISKVSMTIRPSERVSFEQDHTEFKDFVYYVPESKTFQSVDSLYPPTSVLQMTVAKKHSIKIDGLKVVKGKLNTTPIDFYFVVPDDIFDCFGKQTYINKDKKKSKDGVVKHFKQWVCVPCKF